MFGRCKFAIDIKGSDAIHLVRPLNFDGVFGGAFVMTAHQTVGFGPSDRGPGRDGADNRAQKMSFIGLSTFRLNILACNKEGLPARFIGYLIAAEDARNL